MQPYRSGIIVVLVMALVLVAGTPGPVWAGEGFGRLTKKTAKVNRVNPPAVFVMGNRIAVKTSSSDAADSALAQRLQAQLESELIGRDQRFIMDANHPDVAIEVKVLQNRKGERWEKRQETQSRKSGTDAKGKDKFESVEVEVSYKVVSHSVRAAYKVTETAPGTSLDADSLAVDFDHAFREGEGAPDQDQLETAAVDDIVKRITRRLTPTREQIEVLLPQGTLEGLASLADAGLWNRYMEALEKRQPNAKPADESYRQYALGTAYEVLGYAADDPEITLKYLEKADAYYNSAVEANPEEKYFSQPYKFLLSRRTFAPPLERVQSALVAYRRLKEFKDGLASAQAKRTAPELPQESTGGKSLEGQRGGAAGGMDNAAVIRMVRSGLGQDIVLQAIESAPHCAFDVSANGLVALSEAKVDAQIIRRMQQIAAGKKTSRRSEAKRPAAGSAKKPSPRPDAIP
ncbi:MAG: hypothetical protein M3O15_05060 [Acidobacteriota bacterium]|nr:hypothetical protein [Acidobacteriota bacterium]